MKKLLIISLLIGQHTIGFSQILDSASSRLDKEIDSLLKLKFSRMPPIVTGKWYDGGTEIKKKVRMEIISNGKVLQKGRRKLSLKKIIKQNHYDSIVLCIFHKSDTIKTNRLPTSWFIHGGELIGGTVDDIGKEMTLYNEDKSEYFELNKGNHLNIIMTLLVKKIDSLYLKDSYSLFYSIVKNNMSNWQTSHYKYVKNN